MLYNQLKCLLLLFSLFVLSSMVYAQTTVVSGTVMDERGEPIPYVNVYSEQNEGTTTDTLGRYRLTIGGIGDKKIVFSHLTYGKHEVQITIDRDNDAITLDVTLEDADVQLRQVEISGNREDDVRKEASRYNIDAVNAKNLPSTFGDFSKILVTLPGVVSSSELSSSYNVRGGNYDENIIMVNGMPIYRPLIYQAGRQEGLSFVNPDMVQNINFYAGGWQPEYGDKLSSVLDVEYKKPREYEGTVTASMLGANVYAGGNNESAGLNFMAGFRYKNARNLLNTLDIDGEYAPEFMDFQLLLNKTFNSKSRRKPSVNFLFSYAENDYEVIPKSQRTDFGTFDVPLRLIVFYDGNERLNFRTYQSGLRFTYWLNNNIRSQLLVSGLHSSEREYQTVEGFYELCLVNKNTGSSTFDECAINRGVGSNYEYRRNLLDVSGARIENKYEISIDEKNDIELGWGYSHDRFDDDFNEYDYTDSADYVTINNHASQDNVLNTHQVFAYAQHHHSFAENANVTYGIRSHYHDITEQVVINPRIQGSWKPWYSKDLFLRMAAGLYHQPPYYKAFRDHNGNIHKDIKAQSSAHFITGMDYVFKAWDRPFKLMTEVYYKYMPEVIPYEIENVNIRYLPDETAKAFAYGLDMRLSGEFIPGDQSWFSLGYMKTRENIADDGQGYLPRPTDQMINASIFFQDHLPGLTDYKVNLNYFYSSPLPFYTPSGNREDFFRGASYQRLDIGFFKYFDLSNQTSWIGKLKNAWLGVEILNLFGINNVITYTWIQDVSGNRFATPNTLSQRYFNIKLRIEY